MSRREGGRGRGGGGGGGGGYSSRGRGKKLRGGRGGRRIATAEEVEARNAELSRFAAGAASSSSAEEEVEETQGGRGTGDTHKSEGKEETTAAEGRRTAPSRADAAAEGSSSDDSDDGESGTGRQIKFKRPLDFLRQQRRRNGGDDTSEDDDDLSANMGKLQIHQGPQLTRREREAIEQQRRQRRYEKLHAEGKTPEAKADLARLAEVRQRREEAARLRAEGGG